MESTKNTCDECGSLFFERSSKMASLCPECSYRLYGYENCDHEFVNDRCIRCYWDSATSDYITSKVRAIGVGSKVKLISTGEFGIVVHKWENQELGDFEYYIAFFGENYPEGEPESIPYILKYLDSSIEPVL